MKSTKLNTFDPPIQLISKENWRSGRFADDHRIGDGRVGPNERIVGTCGNCGGPVVVPTVIWSVVPPAPRCKRCGATPKRDYGPVLDME